MTITGIHPDKPAAEDVQKYISAAKAGDISTVSVYLNKYGKLILDEKNTDTMAALHYAAWNGHEKVVLLLLDRGAAIDTKSRFGKTPLHYAAHGNMPETAALLLERGARRTVKDHNGNDAAGWARSLGHDAAANIIEHWDEVYPKRKAAAAAFRNAAAMSLAEQREAQLKAMRAPKPALKRKL